MCMITQHHVWQPYVVHASILSYVVHIQLLALPNVAQLEWPYLAAEVTAEQVPSTLAYSILHCLHAEVIGII